MSLNSRLKRNEERERDQHEREILGGLDSPVRALPLLTPCSQVAVWGLGFGFGVLGLGFWVLGLGFWVLGLGFGGSSSL